MTGATGEGEDFASDPRVARRRALVHQTLEQVRKLMDAAVDRKSLEAVRELMLSLAAHRELFPPDEFPAVAEGVSSMYRLSEDADHRYALYVASPAAGRSTPPHDHTTWAVIAGLHGRELNRLYRRLDDGTAPGGGRVALAGEFDIVAGTALAFMPEDVHSIHLGEGGPHLTLHLYGMSIEHTHERTAFDMRSGTSRTFPAASGVKIARGAF